MNKRFKQWINSALDFVFPQHLKCHSCSKEAAVNEYGICSECEAGLAVKINTVLIPGVNESEIEQIAKMGREAGAAVMNLIPLIPCGDMTEYRKPTGEEVLDKRKKASRWIRQFSLCRQCRADACGMI